MEQEHNIEDVPPQNIVRLVIPRYAKVRLTFASSASWKNKILIYSQTNSILVKRGNFKDFNLEPFTFERDRNLERTIKLVGWHRPESGSKWSPSTPIHISNVKDGNGSGFVGFEDSGESGDKDYNDIKVNYTFI